MTRFIRASETPTATGAGRICASVRAAPIGASVIASASALRTSSAISPASRGSAMIDAVRASPADGARTCAAPTIAASSRASVEGLLSFIDDGASSERHLPARCRHFHAGAGYGDDLVGIGALIGIEDAAQLAHHDQVLERKYEGHLGHLFDSDTVLAGQTAAHFDACLQDVAAGLDRAPGLIGVALIVEHDRMDIAVTGVEHVADANVVAVADGDNRAQDVGQSRAWDHAVLGGVIRREAADRAEGALAGFPQRCAF